MNKKHGFLFGFAVIAIAAIFTLAGCEDGSTDDDDGGGGGSKLSGTIKMEQAGTNKFTLTLTGLKWREGVENSTIDLAYGLPHFGLALDGNVTAAGAAGNDPAISLPYDLRYTVVRTSDTVVTVTMSQYVSSSSVYYWGAGSLKLLDFSAKATNNGADLDCDKGSQFVYFYTQEGQASDYSRNYDKGTYNGVLTEASGSASVDFDIAKHN